MDQDLWEGMEYFELIFIDTLMLATVHLSIRSSVVYCRLKHFLVYQRPNHR
jgi:hypothetical protein